MAERGLYQQPESDAAPKNAAVERAADGNADKSYQGYVNRMVEAVDAEVKAARVGERAGLKGKGSRPVMRASRKAEKAALKEQAAIVGEMKTEGYAQLVAEGTLNVGRAVRRAKLADVNGAVASETATPKEIRVKSDGKGAVQLYQSAARNGNVNRQRATSAAVFLTGDKATAKQLREVNNGFTPLDDDHAGWKAANNDHNDPTVIAADLNAPDTADWF